MCESALRVANLAIEDLAEENAILYERLASQQLAHGITRQMLSIALEMLWRDNILHEPHGAAFEHSGRR